MTTTPKGTQTSVGFARWTCDSRNGADLRKGLVRPPLNVDPGGVWAPRAAVLMFVGELASPVQGNHLAGRLEDHDDLAVDYDATATLRRFPLSPSLEARQRRSELVSKRTTPPLLQAREAGHGRRRGGEHF